MTKYVLKCQLLLIRFKSFDVEAGSTGTVCDYDAVHVFGGSGDDATLLGTFCGNIKPTSPLSSEVSSSIF